MRNILSFQPLCGAETLVNYSLDIFRRANVKLNNYLLSILVQVGFISGYVISAFLMSRVKRKHQLAFSSIFMAVSQIVLGFALKSEVNSFSRYQKVTVTNENISGL